MARRKRKPAGPPRIPCGLCTSGFRIVKFPNGSQFATRCSCWRDWKRGTPAGFTGVDQKSRASGE